MSYSAGDIFRYNGKNELSRGIVREQFILAQINSSKVVMISLREGNRWVNPIIVKDITEITDKEFKRICGGEIFKKVNKKDVVISRGRRGNMALIFSAKKK